jgi:hypothetical protein
MRRRTVLAAATAGATAAVAGCGVLDSGDRQHPFAGTTVTVRVDNESSSEHDLEANAQEALAFWAVNSEEYTGFRVDFELVTTSPDMVIRYGDELPECESVSGSDRRVLGCAPKLGPNTTVPEPVVANVIATRLFGLVLLTAKHELGHVLGLGHSDPPQTIMSARPDDRFPLHQVRVDTLEAVLDARERAIEGADQFEQGIREWNDETYARAQTRFETANTAFVETRETLSTTLASFETAVSERKNQRDPTLPVEFTETLDSEGVRSLFDRAIGRADTAAAFAARMAAGARAAGNQDAETANARRDEASELAADFRAVEAVAVRDFAYPLGLTREYNREAIVIPVDSTTI